MSLLCNACNVRMEDEETLKAHYKSDLHAMNAGRRAVDLPPVSAETFAKYQAALATAKLEEAEAAATYVYVCDACDKRFGTSGAFETHIRTKKHAARVKELLAARKTAAETAASAPAILAADPSLSGVSESKDDSPAPAAAGVGAEGEAEAETEEEEEAVLVVTATNCKCARTLTTSDLVLLRQPQRVFDSKYDASPCFQCQPRSHPRIPASVTPRCCFANVHNCLVLSCRLVLLQISRELGRVGSVVRNFVVLCQFLPLVAPCLPLDDQNVSNDSLAFQSLPHFFLFAAT